MSTASVDAVPAATSVSALHEGTLLEVQALRALAVMLVVVYHVRPPALPGGFIGVDVFFVISGFLITAHLLRELTRDGRVDVLGFWSRRIRRLLPAAFLVLAVCVVALFTILPEVVRADTLRQIAGAALYSVNWLLAYDSVDYLAAENAATIVQHYWTLSVEEQFYVGWPLILVAATAVAARFARGRGRGAGPAGIVAWAAGAVVVVSLAYSIFLTWFSPSFAYFSTFTRGWEFAAGALLAALATLHPAMLARARARVVVRSGAVLVAGLAIIVAGAMALSGASPFPGVLAAIPVAGTLLVLIAGFPRPRPLAALVRLRPIQFLGDVSYSLYLWHWPLITGLVLLAGRRPSWWEALLLIAASIVLATLSKRLVEDPVRRAPFFTRRKLPAFALALAGALVFVGVFGANHVVSAAAQQQQSAEVATQIADTSGCFGANAMLGGGDCPEKLFLDSHVDLSAAATDLDTARWCLTWFDEEWASCEFGDLAATNGTLALVGDSHAASMVQAFDGYFSKAGWKVVTFTRFSCSGLNRGMAGEDDPTAEGQRLASCRTWSERVRTELAARTDISRVVYLNATDGYLTQPGYTLTADDVRADWDMMLDAGKSVYAVTDWPRTAGESIPVCLAAQVGEEAPCSTQRSVSQVPDAMDEVLAEEAGRVTGIDLSDAFCGPDTCYSVIGDVVVYADTNHLTGTYSRTLMTYLGPQLIG